MNPHPIAAEAAPAELLSAEAELFQLPVQRTFTDAQRRGDLAAVAVMCVQQVSDMLRLDVLQGGL